MPDMRIISRRQALPKDPPTTPFTAANFLQMRKTWLLFPPSRSAGARRLLTCAAIAPTYLASLACRALLVSSKTLDSLISGWRSNGSNRTLKRSEGTRKE